jgi:four helix bundle protein
MITETSHTRTADASRLDCYRAAVDLAARAAALVPRGHAALRDQIERAASSAALNLAEGYGRWLPREKMHFYAIARGSALETAAAIDIVAARGLADPVTCEHARDLASRVARMLTGLIRSVERRA